MAKAALTLERPMAERELATIRAALRVFKIVPLEARRTIDVSWDGVEYVALPNAAIDQLVVELSTSLEVIVCSKHS